MAGSFNNISHQRENNSRNNVHYPHIYVEEDKQETEWKCFGEQMCSKFKSNDFGRSKVQMGDKLKGKPT